MAPRGLQMHTLRVAVLLGIAAVLCPHGLDAGISFSTPSELRVAGRLRDVRAIDLSGDGLGDIVVLSGFREKGERSWTASVFYQRGAEGFSSMPDQVLDLDTLAVLLSAGTRPGRGGGLLAYVGLGGVYAWETGKSGVLTGPTRRVTLETSIMPCRSDGPIFSDSIRDWDGDGRDDMLVHDFGGFSLLTFEGRDSLVFKTHIDSSPGIQARMGGRENNDDFLSRQSHLSVRYVFPTVQPGGYDLDGKEDLFVLTGDRLAVAVHEGPFHYADPVVVGKFEAPEARPGDREIDVRVSLGDFNGDGLLDVAETWWKGNGLTGTEAEVRLYQGDGRSRFNRPPDQVLTVKDALPYILGFEDLDGDGKDEMIVPTMKLGMMSFVRILTSGVLQIKALIYEQDPGSVFEEEPRYIHLLSAKFDVSGSANIAAGLADFDGDGRMDLAFGTKRNEVSVYGGMGGMGNRIFTREPVLVLNEDASGFLRTDDLNHDGKHDLIFYFPAEGIVRVYFSTG